MAADLEMLSSVVAQHDEELRQLRELHDLHTQMIDALGEASSACVDALRELLELNRRAR